MSWDEQAACKGMDLRIFFPPRLKGRADIYAEGRRICRRCPVQVECLAAADREEAVTGFGGMLGLRGGLSPDERQARRREKTA